MKGNLKLIGLGGMGINVLNMILPKIPSNTTGFANVDVNLIDTTEATITSYPKLQDKFIKIDPSKNVNKELDGLSGERKNKMIVEDIRYNIEKYADTLDIKKNNYYVLLFSASGGSGNLIGTILTKELLKRDANVLVITTVDSSNYLVTHNSIKTLESLDALSRSLNKPLLMSVFFNNDSNGISTPESERKVNIDILKLLGIVSMYTSGDTHDLDHQDMSNFFNTSNYKTFRVEPGLYHLDVGIGDVSNRDDILLTRTLLTTDKEDPKLPKHILHNKTGYAIDEQINKMGVENFPMYLMYVNNKVANIHGNLKDILNALNVKNQTTVLTDNTEDEDIIF